MITRDRLRFGELVKKHTGFKDGADLLYAKGGYFPSLNISDPEVKELADLYDSLQEFNGDQRRAFRW